MILAILGTPKNLARRLCTIISDTEILDTRLKELQVLLLQRHSPRKLILNGITKTVYLDRKELLTVKTQNMKICKDNHNVMVNASKGKIINTCSPEEGCFHKS